MTEWHLLSTRAGATVSYAPHAESEIAADDPLLVNDLGGANVPALGTQEPTSVGAGRDDG